MKTGLKDLDKIIDLDEGKLIVIGAVSGIRETQHMLSLSILINLALEQDIPILLFSLLLERKNIYNRILSNITCIRYNEILEKRLTDKAYKRLANSYIQTIDKKIYIDDTHNQTIEDIEKKCKEMKKSKDIKVVIIDYMELISGSHEHIVEKLKKIAEELNIIILLNSQLTSNADKRRNKMPKLIDLSDKNIVKYSDNILFLYRDDFYYEDSEEEKILKIMILKEDNEDYHVVMLVALDGCNMIASLEKRGEYWEKENDEEDDEEDIEEYLNIEKIAIENAMKKNSDCINIENIKLGARLIKLNNWETQYYILYDLVKKFCINGKRIILEGGQKTQYQDEHILDIPADLILNFLSNNDENSTSVSLSYNPELDHNLLRDQMIIKTEKENYQEIINILDEIAPQKTTYDGIDEICYGGWIPYFIVEKL